MSEGEKQVLIISGMHRSGTSMITSYLQESGLLLGDRLLVGNKDNPKGYFEDVDFLKMHQDILYNATKDGKGGWKDVGFTADGVFDTSILPKYKEQAKNLIAQKQAKNTGVWGWKDPRTSLLLDFWEEIIPEAKYILIFRNPWEVKQSLQKLNKSELENNPAYAYEIWIQHNKSIINFYQKHSDKCILVSANGFLNSPNFLLDLIHEKFKWSFTQPKDNAFYSLQLFNANNSFQFLEESLSNQKVMNLHQQLDELADIKIQQKAYKSAKNELFFSADIIRNRELKLDEKGNLINEQEIDLLNQKQLLKANKELVNKKEEEIADKSLTITQKSEDLVLQQTEIESLLESVKIQQNYNVSLNNVIRSLEEKIKTIENSRLWKFKRKLHKLKTLLRSSKSSLKKKGLLKKLLYFTSKTGRRLVRKILALIFKHGYLFFEIKKVRIIEGDDIPIEHHSDPWQNFLIKSTASTANLIEYKNNIKIFGYQPKVSVIMPVYNAPESFLIQAIESVLEQVYENWELCIADDCSTNSGIKAILEKFAAEDSRIKIVYREENGHISASSNSALEIATGEFVVLLDHDDLLTRDALYQNVYQLNIDKTLDLIYSDEDKVDENRIRTEPHFKPDWCPDNFLARNYVTHLACLRKTIVDEIGGFRIGFEGSQDYDLFLRFTEKTQKIYHIPKILYHWRMHDASTAQEEHVKPYAFEAGVKALQESLNRRGEKATATIKPGLPGFYTVRYDIVKEDMVSIVIPTKDNAKVLETCLESVFEKSTYKNFEIILIDNNSEEKATFDLLDKYEKLYPQQFIRLTLPIAFNFARLMNKAVEIAKGDYIVLLNNDTEIITDDWIEGMLEQSQRESVGAVGVKLLYHNDTIQHAGVVIGLGGVAGHTFIGLPRDSPGYFHYISSTNNYSAVTAACFMVKKDKYWEVGGFNEDFSVEYNDVDFCLKLAEAGYNNIYVPYVELYHYESLTRGHPHMTKTSYERHVREVNLFKSRWGKYIENDPCYNPNLTLDETHFQIRL